MAKKSPPSSAPTPNAPAAPSPAATPEGVVSRTGQNPIDPVTSAELAGATAAALDTLSTGDAGATADGGTMSSTSTPPVAGATRGIGDGFTDGEPEDELTARRDAILLGMLPDMPFDGWTRAAMLRGAELAGYEREAALASFPNGPVEVVEHLSDWADREMLARLQAVDLPALKVRERITLAVRTRLEILAPYKEAIRRSVAFLALPQNAGVGPRILYRTVDAMWFAAGDTATDYNFYTKRMLLAGVQATTLLYWLEDRSEDNADSWAFLDRRIEDVMRVGKGMAQFKGLGSVVNRLPNPLRFTRHLRRTVR